MFYRLLDLIVCPICQSQLINLVFEEEMFSTYMRLENASRVNNEGVVVGPFPDITGNTEIVEILKPFESSPAIDDRGKRFQIVTAIMICPQCERWYPVRESIPELLPDYLRDHEFDLNWLSIFQERLEGEGLGTVIELLRSKYQWISKNSVDNGMKFKKAEMDITKRNLPEGFFGPALFAPFQPLRPSFSLDQILRFGSTVQKLDVGINALILDIGVGYAWTSEWLVRLGHRVIGIDICKDYIIAGIPRMQQYVPYLIVADIENLPLRNEIFDSILSYDAFHHIPNRNQAMQEFDRVMKHGGKISLVEPGKDHEHHPQSIAVMEQHGILEVGMDKNDILEYIKNTSFDSVIHQKSDAHPHDMYVVKKYGDYRPDSFSPRILLASIDIKSHLNIFRIQEPFVLEITLKNSGDTTWLHSTEDQKGEVKLGANLYDQNRNLIQSDFFRWSLPYNLEPENTCDLKCNIPAFNQSGEYILEFDMVVESIIWFKDFYYNAKDFRFLIVSKETPNSTSAPSNTLIFDQKKNQDVNQNGLIDEHGLFWYIHFSLLIIQHEGLSVFIKKVWNKIFQYFY